jgi:putrescine transport system substrate-binding protein
MLAACSKQPAVPPNPTPAAAGDSEKVLNVYNWTDFIDPSVIAGFEREFGIKVHYDVYDSNEMMEVKLLSGHTNYDVVVPGGAFFDKEVKAGVYRKLDKNLLPNLKNLDPGAALATAVYDPGNQYGVDYMWLVTTGLGYNATKVEARLGGARPADAQLPGARRPTAAPSPANAPGAAAPPAPAPPPAAPLDSWRLMFDPKVVSKLKDCGVTVLDSPADVVSAVLSLLGKDPNSESLEDLESAGQVLMSIRPYLRYVDSSRYLEDLANGDICLALGWSGDIVQARKRAQEAGKATVIVYVIPKEGSISIADVLAIPADAPHPANAHLFIDYLLRPEIAAKNAMALSYASGVAGSVALLSEAARSDRAVYPPADVRARLVPMRAQSQEFTRSLMRLWTRFKTGQ